MIALVDCNNFYTSCEKVFRPDLRKKPVVILSNNDGCVISRSQEAKEAGIPMGVPAFKAINLFKKNNVEVFSSNYPLYGDMSRRIMNTLSKFTPNIEVYSIDEAFLDLSHAKDIYAYTRDVHQYSERSTGISLSIGVGHTKTLAKVASYISKKKGDNIFIIDSNNRSNCLRKVPIDKVWGIGRGHLERLLSIQVKTAWEFTQVSDGWVKKHMSVIGLRIKKELEGYPCIEIESDILPKKAICTSRSFGKAQKDLKSIEEAVSTFAARCASKLRKQKSCAQTVSVYLRTNRFMQSLPQDRGINYTYLPTATDSTFDIVASALKITRKMYKKGFYYKKAGVVLSGIVPKTHIQGSLFSSDSNSGKLSNTIDNIHNKYGFDSIKIASQGVGERKGWHLLQEKLSKKYTTSWNDIVTVFA